MNDPLEKRVNLPLQRADFVSDEAHRKYLNEVSAYIFDSFKRQLHAKRQWPLEGVKGVRPRTDFTTDAEYEKYLNEIRGSVYVEFFSRPLENFSLARKKERRDCRAGAGAEALASSPRSKGSRG